MFVVGDVHGHRDVLAGLLRASGLVDRAERWCGGDARLWLLGDLVDRGPDGIGAIDLVRRLERESGGAVRCLLGNHEVLLLAVHRFAAEETAIPGQSFHDLWKLNGGVDGDLAALTPEHARWIASLPPVAREGDVLLVHADTPAYLELGRTPDDSRARSPPPRSPEAPSTTWTTSSPSSQTACGWTTRPPSMRCSRPMAARGSSTATRPSRRFGASIRVRSPPRSSTGTAG